MKTMIVMSDSHGHMEYVKKIERLFAENDYIVHLGDGANDMLEYYRAYPDKVYVCLGNCDYYGSRIALDEWETEIEGHKVFMCHGHKYGVKQGLDLLAYEAEGRGAELALYGHTHIPAEDEIGGVRLINPGSISSYSSRPGYAYIVFTRDKIVYTDVSLI